MEVGRFGGEVKPSVYQKCAKKTTTFGVRYFITALVLPRSGFSLSRRPDAPFFIRATEKPLRGKTKAVINPRTPNRYNTNGDPRHTFLQLNFPFFR